MDVLTRKPDRRVRPGGGLIGRMPEKRIGSCQIEVDPLLVFIESSDKVVIIPITPLVVLLHEAWSNMGARIVFYLLDQLVAFTDAKTAKEAIFCKSNSQLRGSGDTG